MLPQQWGAFEHRLEVTKSVFKPAHKAVEKLSLTISDAPNALYGLPDITSCLIRMSHTERYAGVASDTAREGEAEKMRDGKRESAFRPPVDARQAEGGGQRGSEPRCMDMLRCSVRRARTVGMLRGPAGVNPACAPPSCTTHAASSGQEPAGHPPAHALLPPQF